MQSHRSLCCSRTQYGTEYEEPSHVHLKTSLFRLNDCIQTLEVSLSACVRLGLLRHEFFVRAGFWILDYWVQMSAIRSAFQTYTINHVTLTYLTFCITGKLRNITADYASNWIVSFLDENLTTRGTERFSGDSDIRWNVSIHDSLLSCHGCRGSGGTQGRRIRGGRGGLAAQIISATLII